MNMCRPRRSAITARCWYSDQAGRSNVIAELERAGIAYDKKDPKLAVWSRTQGARGRGLCYESANASFDLLARRTLGKVPEYFRVEQFESMSNSATTPTASASRWQWRW